MTDRTPVCASLVAQTNPTYLGHCDPGAGVGYRLFFYPDCRAADQIETAFPVMTHEEALALIASAERLSAFTPLVPREGQSLKHKDAA